MFFYVISTWNSFNKILCSDPLNFKLHYYNTQSMHTTVSSEQSTRCHSSFVMKLSTNEQINQFEETNEFLCGWSFCSTPNVLPSSMDLQKLTQFAGGYWMSDEDLCNAMKNLDDVVRFFLFFFIFLLVFSLLLSILHNSSFCFNLEL